VSNRQWVVTAAFGAGIIAATNIGKLPPAVELSNTISALAWFWRVGSP
jgi:hypothetical protein